MRLEVDFPYNPPNDPMPSGNVTVFLEVPNMQAQQIGILPSRMPTSFNFVFEDPDGFFKGVAADGDWKVTFQASEDADNWRSDDSFIFFGMLFQQCV